MKKQIMAAAMAVIALAASAEGYQVNSLSAKQNGMGHTGTALKLGAESMFFNPAGMGFMDKTLDVTGSITAIFSHAYCTPEGQQQFATDSEASTPLNVLLGFSVYDNLKFGIAFYTPYGSNINWGENWPGAMLNQSVKLQVMTVQPTVAWRPLKNLSVGAGLTINWGSVDLNKALIPGASLDQTLMGFNQAMPGLGLADLAVFGNTIAASVNLKGNADPRVGMNLGVMWDINEKWTLGFNYRSQFQMKVKAGTATLSTSPAFDNLTRSLGQLSAMFPAGAQLTDIEKALLTKVQTLLALGKLDKASFSAQMPAVAVYRLGVAYKPIEKLQLAFDAQLSQWSAYKKLDFAFADPTAANFNQTIQKDYHNSWLFGLGAEYNLTERFDLRCGLIVDTTPCNKDNYNPETPGMTKIEPSVGLTFRPTKSLAVNAAFLYVQGLGADNRQCTYDDPVAGKTTFKADYEVHAFCPSFGLSYSF